MPDLSVWWPTGITIIVTLILIYDWVRPDSGANYGLLGRSLVTLFWTCVWIIALLLMWIIWLVITR